ncbi:MAG: hypothetical protein ACJA06_001820 [Halocynthiibacter sp.]|jgi:hypothetical protein
MRKHTATAAKTVSLKSATASAGRAQVSISIKGSKRIITSNGIPSHRVGSFPNAGNPNAIRAQSYNFTMPLTPKSGSGAARGMGLTGVAVNGVPFDPGAAEFWQGNPNSGWQYEALGGAVTLGLDANYAHVQPTGAYHYHGLPIGLMQQLGWSASAASPLIGWASDGYPIYAITAASNGAVREMKSSYKLRSGKRPGGSGPSGAYDGAFVQDYTYVAGSGDLDAHNGAMVRTAEYPEGTYAYFLTKSFPVIPRSLKGAPDASFSKRRG